jgi:hypothetical protein
MNYIEKGFIFVFLFLLTSTNVFAYCSNNSTHTFSADENRTLLGYTVTLVNVGSTNIAMVNVNGVSATIEKGSSKIINDVKIKVLNTHYSEIKSERTAILMIEELCCDPNEFTFDVDENITILENIITLVNVGSNNTAMVNINGVSATIEKGSSKIINDVKIKVLNTHYSEIKSERKAILMIGKLCDSTIPTTTSTSIFTTTTIIPTTTLNCRDLYWFDNNVRTCDSTRHFCGMYMYLGLHTFETKEECLSALQSSMTTTILLTTTTTYTSCQSGCLLDDSCIPFGTRIKTDSGSSFCDIDKEIKLQKEIDETCMNSFECKSNECSNEKCISTYNLLQKILEFFKNIFRFGKNK